MNLIDPSPLESERFGYAIGRAVVDSVHDVRVMVDELDPFDVAIVRTDAGRSAVPCELARLPGRCAIAADQLLYWERRSPVPIQASPPEGWWLDHSPSVADVVFLVRDIFRDYTNHYAANPLFPSGKALEGYAEWAGSLVTSDPTSAVILRQSSGSGVGLAIVDFHTQPPDVRLAGIRLDHRRRGLYSSVLADVTKRALQQGHDCVEISTQSSNTSVMRAWARHGFLPKRAIATFHVVRAELIG